MKYFTLEELTRSDTASIKHIDNTPDEKTISNLNILVDNLLDTMREKWAKYCNDNNLGNPAIIVTSGYRSNLLNKAVGGSKTSDHLWGFAADLKPANKRMEEFDKFIEQLIPTIKFSQIIREKPKKGVPSWWHISYNPNNLKNQYFTLV